MTQVPARLEDARAAIADLVERYTANRGQYQTTAFTEENCRAAFITPLFEALGWDVTNRAGYAEQYKDVVHEEGIKVGDYTKAPDYTFRVAGVRKFFVEAKKPFVDLKNDPAPAYQLRRYAWSAKLPLSILTDFEEIAVYDTRIRPKEGDKPSVGRILYITFDELLPRLEELWAVFSKEAVLKGSFDRYAEDTRGKRGTSEVDTEFLREIEGWRDELARNIAIRNIDLSVDDLNFAVQTTIDRIIFLRIAEGRGAEQYGSLLALVNGADIYKRLVTLYRKADARYNSGLFDFKSDRLTTDLAIDDKVLKPILQNLYYPQSPYEFSVLPAEILGNVYEQFLGKVIRLTKGHRAVVEEKPEVKKAGGVYYTPAYIVDYIVQHTVGELCEGKSPKQMEKLRILDPACGSGSFLLKAYQEPLDRHLAWYCDHQPEKHRKEVFPGPGGDWRLTTAEKRRIVLNNIYGVDIDRQAVEVTKLSLLLKVLEGENDETLKQHSLFGERALPSLEANIKCGNSLIAPQDLGDLAPDQDELRRINPFSWKTEFPSVFKEGGFDAVIGNPPYIRIQTLQEWAPQEVALYKGLYRSAASGNYDMYVVFVEKGLSLMNEEGRLGLILPHKFFNAKYGEGLRRLIAEERRLSGIVHFGDQQVFEKATTYTCLLFLEGRARKNAAEVAMVPSLSEWRAGALPAACVTTVPQGQLGNESWAFVAGAGAALLEKLRAIPTKLEDLTDRIFQGLKTSADKIYIVDELARSQKCVRVYSRQTEKEHLLEAELLHPLVKGGDSRPYLLTTTARRILFPYAANTDGAVQLLSAAELRSRYPMTWQYLSENKAYLESREDGRMAGPGWYAFGRTQALEVIGLPKIFTPDIASRASFSLDATGHIFFTGGAAGGYGVLVSEGQDRRVVLGLLNSRVLEWYIRQTAAPMRGGYFSFEARFIRQLPLPLKDSSRAKILELIAGRVDAVQDLKRNSAKAKTPQEQVQLQRQIESNEDAINSLVYELYGLTKEEVAIVEAATSS
ncbi:MAG: Eco57I restriction-modification methylase domain-containing protein [Acidobacteria bacterium]|nr:Eco57I restriction-modification methylase domain-containing protein [Acidobacteriota bacterium]